MVTKVTLYFIMDVVWGLLDKLYGPHFKKHFKKTNRLPETTVVSAKSDLPKYSKPAY
jgi:hypothetical protein